MSMLVFMITVIVIVGTATRRKREERREQEEGDEEEEAGLAVDASVLGGVGRKEEVGLLNLSIYLGCVCSSVSLSGAVCLVQGSMARLDGRCCFNSRYMTVGAFGLCTYGVWGCTALFTVNFQQHVPSLPIVFCMCIIN